MGYFIFVRGVDHMHMADALLSPVVGGTMLAASVGVAAYSIKKTQNDLDKINSSHGGNRCVCFCSADD